MNSSSESEGRLPDTESSTGARAALAGMSAPARASMVNRTHRIVRERARILQARRNRIRSLWIPLTICSALLVILCSALWTVLDGYELVPTGIPDSSGQFMVVLFWFFPVSMALLAMVWFRRIRKRTGDEAAQ